MLPSTAKCLKSLPAQVLINCGRNSLAIFSMATVLSFVGFAVMLEGGRGLEYQVAVNGLGIGLLGCAAWLLTQRGRHAVRTPQLVEAEQPRRSDVASQ
jgi:hypothetical protein